MNLGNLAEMLGGEIRNNPEFCNLKLTVIVHGPQDILFEGTVGTFIKKVYSFELNRAFGVCEILRDFDLEYGGLPVRSKPLIITVE